MDNIMQFPETFEEFAKSYGFKDSKEIYTNGAELIPVFRVEQWLEHAQVERTCQPFVSPDGAGWYAIGCSNCGHGFADNNPDKEYLLRISKRSDIMPRYCSGCGAKVEVIQDAN